VLKNHFQDRNASCDGHNLGVWVSCLIGVGYHDWAAPAATGIELHKIPVSQVILEMYGLSSSERVRVFSSLPSSGLPRVVRDFEWFNLRRTTIGERYSDVFESIDQSSKSFDFLRVETFSSSCNHLIESFIKLYLRTLISDWNFVVILHELFLFGGQVWINVRKTYSFPHPQDFLYSSMVNRSMPKAFRIFRRT